MKLRAPAYPLITVDPYFSVWSQADKLTDTSTVHWSGRIQKLLGTVSIDGKEYRVMGEGDLPAMTQTSVDMTAFSTVYTFQEDKVELSLCFTSPILPNDLYLISRPVSFLEVSQKNLDGKAHRVSVRISVSEEICMNRLGDGKVSCACLDLGDGVSCAKMGLENQKPLSREGDDLRIEWGYFYLSVNGKAGIHHIAPKADDATSASLNQNETFAYAESDISNTPALFSFAYDDVYSIEYFNEPLSAYWRKDGALIEAEILKAHREYAKVMRRCAEFEAELRSDATCAGGEKYAELLELSLRQTIAAHKLVIGNDGELLFISKECFSNGCAATVDVSYPSIPLFLLYNTELVKGMVRPIFKYARSDEWSQELGFDFAPHDVGRYPLLNGQRYSLRLEKQMPVEECGNMLIMTAAVCVAENDVSFALSNMDLLLKWVVYLTENGADPSNQLCTDDFAGHLAHNCNLTLKAIMGIASLGIIYGMNKNEADEQKYMRLARELALDWQKRASNGDGSYRLAFDKPNTFSMKYNIVWDKLFGTNIMPREVIASEVANYRKRLNTYGLPLDSRESYTKSDWTVWAATLAERREDFEELIEPMWNAYDSTDSRVPMTDWYWTSSAEHKTYFSTSDQIEKSFRNRTVQGGLFIKLLEYKGIIKLK